MIAESDQPFRGWIRQILEAKGYHVDEAGDGYQGLAVLDLHLCKINGLEIVIYLQAHVPSLKTLAFCHNLGEGIGTWPAATVLGAGDALAKPFSAEEFLPRVETLLSHP